MRNFPRCSHARLTKKSHCNFSKSVSLTVLRLQNFGKTQNYTTWQLGGLPLNYLATLIWVNVPQLILSFLYLTVNALHTQLQVEQEWNSYSCQYAPLRVSYPTGDQISTYRLQLPYKYSVPLIAVSILLHWLVSNSLFLLVVEGGKYQFSASDGG